MFKDDVTRDDLQRRFLAQHSAAMLGQCCTYSKECRNNVATLCCAKNGVANRLVSRFDPITYKTKLLSIVHGKNNYNNWCGYLK